MWISLTILFSRQKSFYYSHKLRLEAAGPFLSGACTSVVLFCIFFVCSSGLSILSPLFLSFFPLPTSPRSVWIRQYVPINYSNSRPLRLPLRRPTPVDCRSRLYSAELAAGATQTKCISCELFIYSTHWISRRKLEHAIRKCHLMICYFFCKISEKISSFIQYFVE